MVEDGDRVAVQFTWTATVTADLGAVPAGTRLMSHVAAFSIFRDGLVLEQSSNDCYKPIARSLVNLVSRTATSGPAAVRPRSGRAAHQQTTHSAPSGHPGGMRCSKKPSCTRP